MIGKHFQTCTGELLTVIEIKDEKVIMQLYDMPELMIEGEAAKFDDWFKQSGSKELSKEVFDIELAEVKKHDYKPKGVREND